jgi:16S rRNA processing protein RimM
MSEGGPEGLLEVGRIGRPHGVRGDVFVSLSTDRVERVRPGARLRVRDRWLTISSSRPQQQRWVVHFEGIDDRSDAERLTLATVWAEPLDDADALWVHELIGARVVETDGTDRGVCVAVLDNPAHDLLELDSGALVPVTFVVSHADGVITIDPPDGLFDLD